MVNCTMPLNLGKWTTWQAHLAWGRKFIGTRGVAPWTTQFSEKSIGFLLHKESTCSGDGMQTSYQQKRLQFSSFSLLWKQNLVNHQSLGTMLRKALKWPSWFGTTSFTYNIWVPPSWSMSLIISNERQGQHSKFWYNQYLWMQIIKNHYSKLHVQ